MNLFASDASPGAVDLVLWILLAMLSVLVHLWWVWVPLAVILWLIGRKR